MGHGRPRFIAVRIDGRLPSSARQCANRVYALRDMERDRDPIALAKDPFCIHYDRRAIPLDDEHDIALVEAT